MIRCVCLVEETDDKILLVQVRHQAKYYFPGGKIDAGESLEVALQREIKEELQLDVKVEDLTYIGKVVGDAYPQPDTETELNGFKCVTPIDWSQVEIDNEITDIKWVSKADDTIIAPAVQTWIETFS